MGSPKKPKVVKRDLAAEQEEAARKATEKANAEIAYRRSRRAQSSLIANPGGAAGLTSLIASPYTQKDTLG